MVGTEKRVRLVAQDIIDHFEKRLDAMDVAGPQKWNRGNVPSLLWSSSRRSGGSDQQSGSLRPSDL